MLRSTLRLFLRFNPAYDLETSINPIRGIDQSIAGRA